MTVPVRLPSAENSTTVTVAGPSDADNGRAAAIVLRRKPQKVAALMAVAAETMKARRPQASGCILVPHQK